MTFSRLTTVSLAGLLALSACSPAPTSDAAATPGAPAPAPARVSPAPARPAPDRVVPPPAPVKPRSVTVPAGTEISVILIDSLSTKTNQAGDQFTASLAAPLVIDGKTVLDRGSKVQGRVVDAEDSGRVKGRASIQLVLNGIMDGARMIPVVTKTFVVEAEGTKGRDAAVAGGGAGVGAAIGAIAGGKKGAGVGAIIGGAAGTGAVLATKGKEVEFPSESKLRFTLDRDAEFPARN